MRVGAADDDAMYQEGEGAPVAGDFWPRLRRLFIQFGGDPSRCPFGHDYAGPVIRWSDEGWPYMHSSKQKELFDEGQIQDRAG
jgi:hypothetical protein